MTQIATPSLPLSVLLSAPMRAVRCPICKKALEARTKNFPFCSARCKLIDAGNWLEGSYRVADRDDGAWGENR